MNIKYCNTNTNVTILLNIVHNIYFIYKVLYYNIFALYISNKMYLI